MQAEVGEAARDKVYQRLLWSWVGVHCALLAACADAVHSHNLHPLACLGKQPCTHPHFSVILFAAGTS